MTAIRQRFKVELMLHGYAGNTIDAYIRAVRKLAEFYNKNPLLLSNDQIQSYMLRLQKNVAVRTYNTNAAGILRFYEYCAPDRPAPRIKQLSVPFMLPEVLSMEEVKNLLESTISLKYKAILSLMYSSGLRIGECVRVQPTDIDSKRKLVHIRNAKGNKDRYAIIGDSAIALLRQYYIAFNKPTPWLFEGAQKGKPLHIRSIQHVFRQAVKDSGITKKIRPHTLRHSFATHLLEQKCPLPAIQMFLGHKNLKSTLMYTHVTPRALADIVNPLDAIISVKGAEVKND